MLFDSFDAQSQSKGDFLIGLALGDEHEHFLFTRGKLANPGGRMPPLKGLAMAEFQLSRDHGAVIGVPFPNLAYCLQQVLCSGVFGHITGSPGVKHSLDSLSVVISRKNKNFRVRQITTNMTGSF